MADDTDSITFVDADADAFQYIDWAEGAIDVLNPNQLAHHGQPSTVYYMTHTVVIATDLLMTKVRFGRSSHCSLVGRARDS